MARPTKYTPALSEAILRLLKMGSTRMAAAESVGIDYETFRRWMVSKAEFCGLVTRAESEAEAKYTQILYFAATPHEVTETTTTTGPDGTITTKTVVRTEHDWRAALEWLERRRRLDWGRTIDIRRIDDDTLLRLLSMQAGSVADEEYTLLDAV